MRDFKRDDLILAADLASQPGIGIESVGIGFGPWPDLSWLKLKVNGVESEWVRKRDLPRIVCLVGSSRFKDQHITAMRLETLVGRIVIPMGLYGHVEGLDMDGPIKVMLDELHLRKIDLADEILVVDGPRKMCRFCNRWYELEKNYPWFDHGVFVERMEWTKTCSCNSYNPNIVPYIGDSTRREIDYVTSQGKPVRYWSHEQAQTSEV
jgi:hypothetical protein